MAVGGQLNLPAVHFRRRGPHAVSIGQETKRAPRAGEDKQPRAYQKQNPEFTVSQTLTES
jgi:hypothetical protein